MERKPECAAGLVYLPEVRRQAAAAGRKEGDKMTKLYTVQEVAEILHKKPCTVREMVKRGEFGDTYNDGRQHLIYENELADHMARKTGTAVSYHRNFGGGKAAKKNRCPARKLVV